LAGLPRQVGVRLGRVDGLVDAEEDARRQDGRPGALDLDPGGVRLVEDRGGPPAS